MPRSPRERLRAFAFGRSARGEATLGAVIGGDRLLWPILGGEMADPKLPALTITTLGKATRAESDEQRLESWIASLTSAHSRRNSRLPPGASSPSSRPGACVTVEDTRDALGRITRDVSEATGRQYVLRVKSLLGYAHRLRYAHFNAGAHL